MTNAELIKRLRDFAGDLTVIDPEAHGPAIELCHEAADALEALEAKRVNLKAKLANAERRADDAESRNDFLLSEIDEIIKRERHRI